MVLTAMKKYETKRIERGRNPLLIGSMVLTWFYAHGPKGKMYMSQSPLNRVNGSHTLLGLQTTIMRIGRNPLLIGSMVLTKAIFKRRVYLFDRRNPLLIGSMVLTGNDNASYPSTQVAIPS